MLYFHQRVRGRDRGGGYVLSSATNHSKSHIKCTNILSKAFLGLTAVCWFCGCSVVPSHSFSAPPAPAPAPRARPAAAAVFLLWSFKLLVLFSPRTTQLCSSPNRCKHPKVKEQADPELADLEPADLEVLGFIPVPAGLHPSQQKLLPRLLSKEFWWRKCSVSHPKLPSWKTI